MKRIVAPGHIQDINKPGKVIGIEAPGNKGRCPPGDLSHLKVEMPTVA